MTKKKIKYTEDIGTLVTPAIVGAVAGSTTGGLVGGVMGGVVGTSLGVYFVGTKIDADQKRLEKKLKRMLNK